MASSFMGFNSLATLSTLLFFFQRSYSFTTPETVRGLKPISSTYMIHIYNPSKPAHFSTEHDWYTFMVQSVTSSNSENLILYTYKIAMHGFAAKLTPAEVEDLAKMPGVLHIYEDHKVELHTTRTPDFLGLDVNFGIWPDTNFGNDVIIGLIDSGIWPESDSFKDYGLGPIGPEWKGECENGTRFLSSYCNNKLIGARSFSAGMESMLGPIDEWGYDYKSPRDGHGHGTHTSSTAAGAPVANANMLGFANGTARGIATRARIAMYKACWGHNGCADSDIMAAIEQAIEDGVHILSISLGSMFEYPYYQNPIMIGTFSAVQHGIAVACSAGNSGPTSYSVVNSAPWVTTVGAGSIDRTFPVEIKLGNGEIYTGGSLYSELVNTSDFFPLVHLDRCRASDIIPDTVMGKLVACSQPSVQTGFLVQEAGGVGIVGLNAYYKAEGIKVDAFTLPSLVVAYSDGLKILSYMNKTMYPTASIKSECLTVEAEDRAPMVAFFSSIGPNTIVPELLKPDILAPGFNILASWADDMSPTSWDMDPRRMHFSIISGTSMSCPHIAGIAALLRNAHPDWSPAAIRSAMMTTSVVLDNQHRPIAWNENLTAATPMKFGAGHVNPSMARDPGLIYDADETDYVNFLCSLNYTQEQLQTIVKMNISSCTPFQGGPGELNYPSFSVVFNSNSAVHLLKRTVTNVGNPAENYTVSIVNGGRDKVEISVKPDRLMFTEMEEQLSYSIEFKSKVINGSRGADMVFGYVVWESEQHIVKSPVTVAWM